MSTLQYAFLSLVMLTVALEAKEILHAQEGVPTTGRFIVSLDLDTPTERFEDLAAKIELEAGDQNIHKVDGRYTKIITAKLSEESLEKIKDEANVRYIEEEIIVTTAEPVLSQAVPSQAIPSQAIPWHLDRINQRRLPLDGRFSSDQTGAGVDIYILDSGIRLTHNEFGGRALYPGRDPVDDAEGTNQDGVDCRGHGTHVAGLAGGRRHGVATGANLYSVRVINCAGVAAEAVVTDGINYAAQEIRASGRRGVINMSLGTNWPQIIRAWIDAIDAAVRDNIPVVVAAGNLNEDACTHTPDSADNAIVVGGTNNADERMATSNWGACLDIFAPGADITSASNTADDDFTIYNGNSQAAPIVSGVVATMLERDNTLTPAQIAQELIDSSTPNTVTNPGVGSPNRLLFIDISWPEGPYALPKPVSGCPNADKLSGEGYIYQDNEDYMNRNSHSYGLSTRLKGTFDSNTKIYYCVYETGGAAWPSGSYCIAMYNGRCPSGFSIGYIVWDDEDDRNANSRSGSYPTGSYGRETMMFFCCRNDGSHDSPMALPTGEPFYLYLYGDASSCQEVVGMRVREDYCSTDDENDNNGNRVEGPVPWSAENGDRDFSIHYCYYY